jgi:hypothetical protein
MKTTFSSTMRTLTTAFALAFTLFAGSVSAQSVQFTDQAALHTQTSDQFKVAVFPVQNSLLMKVLFENPAKEKITVLIKNSSNEIVYKKEVGNAAIFNGKFDVSKMTDGTYTMVIESKHQSYSNPFSVQTYQERIARAL